ncbi:hypothetical protein [Actinomadura harenae]|uniref:Uncharacterized protein n=1 Tax=Actinomadura harenae TaxID=2483351 RepID=A0A3M2M3X8_9ACTN|nr:hypothetical protein [Actinomadura harenae]RMI44484.1 hypothetical protein EBO15_12620 [Actinomadura harenae]
MAFLGVLHEVIKERHPGLRSTVVLRSGCPVLFVFNSIHVAHCADIGCDFDRGVGWRFTWAASGVALAAVVDAVGAADRVARMLRVQDGRAVAF